MGMRSVSMHKGASHLGYTKSSYLLECFIGFKTRIDAIVSPQLQTSQMQMSFEVSIQRAALQKVEDDQVNTISKAANPGKFKDECKWPDWEPALIIYLLTIPGSYHVLLSYVIREEEEPTHNQDFGDDFVSEMIACAPLHGAHFRADSQHVHQLLKNYLVAEIAKQWIKRLEQHANG